MARTKEQEKAHNRETSTLREKWVKENTTIIGCRFHNNYDSEMVEYLKDFKPKSTELKRLAYVGLQYEKKLRGEESSN